MRKSLTRVDELVAAGLADGGARVELEQVAARYAVAVTPAMADLIPPHAPDDPWRCNSSPGPKS